MNGWQKHIKKKRKNKNTDLGQRENDTSEKIERKGQRQCGQTKKDISEVERPFGGGVGEQRITGREEVQMKTLYKS